MNHEQELRHRWSPSRVLLGAGLVGAGIAGVVFSLTALSATDQEFTAGQEILAAAQLLPESPVVGIDTGSEDGTTIDASTARMSRLEFWNSDGTTRKVFDEPLYVGVGVDDKTLESGPGWYTGTSLPSGTGNVAIAGHRTGWGSPFRDLDRLTRGDLIVVTMNDGAQYEYRVKRTFLVQPNDDWVLSAEPLGRTGAFLTLTTCDPPGVNDKRLIVVAEQLSDITRA